ncbi:hypothetical protein COU74_02090 [Candidatus Peregrinibacteria bacterium CG10_big_fil_rev_8_21_14_0_10_36_19]|nr:MAG: hypothetical protein COU74_02090 [Candidatus Peregrinibacteria bacterium CG10_big_fil_rev_8_21_14_0_10_36_19]
MNIDKLTKSVDQAFEKISKKYGRKKDGYSDLASLEQEVENSDNNHPSNATHMTDGNGNVITYDFEGKHK